MHFMTALEAAWQQRNSLLCVGLDPDPAKFPAHLQGRPDAILEFCKAVVDATADLVCCFKPQIAYFAAHRAEDQLEALIEHIHLAHPDTPVILDAKRGDIGSTAEQYAIEAFERFKADAITVNPYMGRDSVDPYLAYPEKGDPAVPHVQSGRVGPAVPRRRHAAGAHEALRARRPHGGRGLERQRQLRPGGRRHLPGRDRARTRTDWRHAAAGARHRRAGRRHRRDHGGRADR